ncbi:hypothetical protein V1227_05400 [Lentzea sp. DG1S-22]|nr:MULTISPECIES: hypothetical protein [unclassified Lentzea]MCG8927671.1 hypothetical protein [Lentzea sp. CC55]WVH82195.1 hypothetical protein V1227_05400 [Lentzea sp. DG1S-22]
MKKHTLPEMDVLTSVDLVLVAANPSGARVERPAARIPEQRRKDRR